MPVTITVEDFLKSDRQWARPLRIAHAQYQLRQATTEDARSFWLAVLLANQP